MRLKISAPGKPTVYRTGNEFATLLSMAYPSDSVDIALMNLDVGKTMTFTIKGETITVRKEAE